MGWKYGSPMNSKKGREYPYAKALYTDPLMPALCRCGLATCGFAVARYAATPLSLLRSVADPLLRDMGQWKQGRAFALPVPVGCPTLGLTAPERRTHRNASPFCVRHGRPPRCCWPAAVACESYGT